MRRPGVFVSSTFYDLKQIRADLRDFLEVQLGYRALISEMSTFPVDPEADTIDNSRKRVQDSSDIFVLIVGSRYGTVLPDREISITNLEYEVARAKGLPIYAFVDKGIISNLPTWKDNPTADFSSVVDTSQLFEFVQQVRSHDRVWTFPFESAQGIVETLRNQLAYLMQRGLSVQARLKGDTGKFKDLSGQALRVAIDKKLGWQAKVFAILVESELDEARDLKRAYDLEIHFGVGELIEGTDAFGWLGYKADEAARLSTGIDRLVNNALSEAFKTNDVQEIAYGAREIGRAYRQAITWSLEVRKAYVDDEFKALRDELSLFTANIIDELEEFGPALLHAVDEGIRSAEGEEITIEFEFVITVANEDAFHEELERVKAEMGLA